MGTPGLPQMTRMNQKMDSKFAILVMCTYFWTPSCTACTSQCYLAPVVRPNVNAEASW